MDCAAYLVWLGIKLWRAPIAVAGEGGGESATERPLRIFLHAYAVTALNPKSITFFVAFLPQFLDLSRPLVRQMVVFEATFLALAAVNAMLYASLASTAGSTIRMPHIHRIVNRDGSSLLISAGILSLGFKRATA